MGLSYTLTSGVIWLSAKSFSIVRYCKDFWKLSIKGLTLLWTRSLLIYKSATKRQSTRIEIKLYKIWSIWVKKTFFGHKLPCSKFFIILNAILIKNSQFFSEYKSKMKAVEIFCEKFKFFHGNFQIFCWKLRFYAC